MDEAFENPCITFDSMLNKTHQKVKNTVRMYVGLMNINRVGVFEIIYNSKGLSALRT